MSGHGAMVGPLQAGFVVPFATRQPSTLLGLQGQETF